MNETKKCIACNEIKPANTMFFYKAKRLEFGLDSYCKLCKAKKAKKYYIKYSEKKREKKRDERVVTLNKYSKTEMFYNNILVNYALTREKYRAILREQEYKCASCGIKIKIKTSRIDYDRGLNKVRGIVCKHCYTLLDCFKGNLSRLKACVKYIRNF